MIGPLAALTSVGVAAWSHPAQDVGSVTRDDGCETWTGYVRIDRALTASPHWQAAVESGARSAAMMQGIELVEMVSTMTSPTYNFDPDLVTVRTSWMARRSPDVASVAMQLLKAYRVRARDIGVLGYSPSLRRMHQQYRRRQLARRRSRRSS